MKSAFFLLFLGITASISAEPIDLDRQTGKIYRVNFEEKSFEFISTTAYDPKGHEGKTRHTVHWDEQTEFLSVESQSDFTGLDGITLNGRFFYLDDKQSAAVRTGKIFTCRSVEVLEDSKPVTGLRRDGKALSARFIPTDATRARVQVGDQEIPFRLGHRRSVHIIKTESESFLKHEVFKARVFGKIEGDRFVVKTLRLTPLPDPRKDEDPKLARFLIIGDSISMNYDAAARKALEGVVNFHRIDSNGGPTTRGIESMDLWLGDHRKPGFHWDIIQFNHGLHDLRQDRKPDGTFGAHAIELPEYKRNLERVIRSLKKTGATLIWCNTTPVPNHSGETSGRRKDEDLIYNQAALEVMKRHPEILINDLNQAVRNSPAFDEWRKGDNVHFKRSEELNVLGDAVATAVKRAIKRRR